MMHSVVIVIDFLLRPLSFLQVLKKTLKIFLETKRVLNMKHEYAIVLINDHTTFWVIIFYHFLILIKHDLNFMTCRDIHLFCYFAQLQFAYLPSERL